MASTYNLKNPVEYQDFFDMVVKDLTDNNLMDSSGFPLDDIGEPITTDYLWEEFGQFLDGTQTGLGYQVFNEVIEYFND